jgi:hypothetical protein
MAGTGRPKAAMTEKELPCVPMMQSVRRSNSRSTSAS